MKADAIIFDKDGTLIDFDAFWVAVSVQAVEDVLKKLGREDISVNEIITAFGVNNGITDINAVLCKGTYEQLGKILYEVLTKYGCDISPDEAIKDLVDAYNESSNAGEIIPTCSNLKEVLVNLKKQNKKLAVITTYNEDITYKCLKKLGIETLFDKIYTDDGKNPSKPDPYCALDFCRLTGVKKERTLMVGDTLTDVAFAENAGIKIVGVAKTQQNREQLAPFADAVISDVSHLLEILE